MNLPPCPWTVDEENFVIRDANGITLIFPTENVVLRKLVVLRRICAAVNACERFTTVGLEDMAKRDETLEFALRESLRAKQGAKVAQMDFGDEMMNHLFLGRRKPERRRS